MPAVRPRNRRDPTAKGKNRPNTDKKKKTTDVGDHHGKDLLPR